MLVLRLDLRSVSLLETWHLVLISRHTLHGLLSSNPAGALGLSVCPLRNPVSRLSRSITAIVSSDLYVLHALLAEPLIESSHTLSVPRVYRMSRSLASILHVPHL